MRKSEAFSLVEVTLAIGIIAFALLAIFALIPVGMSSGRAAVDATQTSLMAADVQSRIQSAVTDATFSSSSAVTLPVLYYNSAGLEVAGSNDALYKAVATIEKDWGANAPPLNVDQNYLRPVTVQIGWPIDPSNGNVIGNNAARFTFSFYVRKP